LLLLVVGGRWLLAGLQLTSRHQELTAAIEAEYRALVPEARNLIDPRYQLETELTRLRATQAAQARPRDFLVLLDGVAAALGDDAGLHALTFDATGLRLELDAPNLERLAAIEQRLAAVGAVTRDAARPEGERVRGTVQLAEPAR
jgi:type II secretion system protein L